MAQSEFQKSPKGREIKRRYAASPKGREMKRRCKASPKVMANERQRKVGWYHERGGREQTRKQQSSEDYLRRRRERRLDQALDITRTDYNPERAARLLARWHARER